MDDEWLSLQQAADACGMAYRTFLRLVQRGELPEKPDGKPYRLRRADVEAFMERALVKPGDLANLYNPRGRGSRTAKCLYQFQPNWPSDREASG